MELDVSILFSAPKVPLMSEVISKVTNSRTSHTAISFFDASLGQRLVLEAWWFGFRVITYKHWLEVNRKVAEYKLPKYNFSEALGALATNIGTKYEYKTFFWAGLDALLSRVGVQLKPVQTPNKYICSEAVLRLLKDVGVPSVQHLENEATDPGELYEIAKSDPDFVEV
jgi:hypothetical protein